MALVPQNLGVPTGTIMWSASPQVPAGWLLCDGRSVAKADYPILADYIDGAFGQTDITFGLPDLVGRFIRGVGEAGRDPFTYQDGVNRLHRHGLYPDISHLHGVTDPGHVHVMTEGIHAHGSVSDHTHGNTTNHTHTSPSLPLHYYTLAVHNCNREVFADDQPLGDCLPDPADVLVTQKRPAAGNPAERGVTNITAVNSATTGVTFDLAKTGVLIETAQTGVFLEPSPTGIVIDNEGNPGGPVPVNLALLPIIRT